MLSISSLSLNRIFIALPLSSSMVYLLVFQCSSTLLPIRLYSMFYMLFNAFNALWLSSAPEKFNAYLPVINDNLCYSMVTSEIVSAVLRSSISLYSSSRNKCSRVQRANNIYGIVISVLPCAILRLLRNPGLKSLDSKNFTSRSLHLEQSSLWSPKAEFGNNLKAEIGNNPKWTNFGKEFSSDNAGDGPVSSNTNLSPSSLSPLLTPLQ